MCMKITHLWVCYASPVPPIDPEPLQNLAFERKLALGVTFANVFRRIDVLDVPYCKASALFYNDL